MYPVQGDFELHTMHARADITNMAMRNPLK